MMQAASNVATADFDGIALKPTEHDLVQLPEAVSLVVIDYEGEAALPDPDRVRDLPDDTAVRLTAPVRADGFDPHGDDRHFERFGNDVSYALVPGNGAYLEATWRNRAIAPRLAAALDRYPDAWVGTEGIERLALATGATQYELLSPRTATAIAAIRTAGFPGPFAVYAPTAIIDDRERALAALEGYLGRRPPVRRALADASTPRDRRDILDRAMDDYAIVGTVDEVNTRLTELRDAGATTIVGYPVLGALSGR